MQTLKSNNNLAPATCPSGTDKPLKTPEEFGAFCLAEFDLRYQSLRDEFNGRYQGLKNLRDMKVAEYDFMLTLVYANARQLQQHVDIQATLALEQQLAELNFETVRASLTLHDWRRQIGQDKLLVILCDVINYFLSQFEIKNKLTEQQIMNLSAKLLVAKKDLKILELVFVLQRALNGEYKHYNHIGIDTILGWLSRYHHECADYAEGHIQNMNMDEARGTQPWLEEEKRLLKYRDEQMEKKRINDAIWGREKQEAERQQRHEAYRQEINNRNNGMVE